MSFDLDIPTHRVWPRVQARRLFTRARRPAAVTDGIVTAFRDGEVTLRENRRVEGFTNADKEIGYQGIRRGDLVIHAMDAFAGAIGVSDSDGKASPVVHAYLGQQGIDPRYFAYLLRVLAKAGLVAALAKGIRERSTSFDQEVFRSLLLPVPSEPEQRAIADFLDAETARIDALLGSRQKMLTLLADRLSANTAGLVLNGDAKTTPKPAAGSFIAATRLGWAVTTLRHLRCAVQTGPFGSQLHAGDYVENGWPVVNPTNIVNSQLVPSLHSTVNDATRARLVRHTLRAGDIVFGRRGEMGRAAMVRSAEEGWLCGTGSLRLRLVDERMDPEYLALLLQTEALRAYFSVSSVGSTMENLNSEIVLGCPVLVPPRGEQQLVVDKVARIGLQYREVSSAQSRQVDLLRERRQALITAAVTGEIDLSTASGRGVPA